MKRFFAQIAYLLRGRRNAEELDEENGAAYRSASAEAGGLRGSGNGGRGRSAAAFRLETADAGRKPRGSGGTRVRSAVSGRALRFAAASPHSAVHSCRNRDACV